ncbi:retrovirus-related pol polyprotein from transposon TNT 1-94 [Tanacetum coccineum]
MTDPAWIESMQEELLQFKRLDHYEENTVIQNKTCLVVRGYRQEEGIDFEESFASIAIIEAIKIFLAYAAHKSFMVFQMDVKTAFLHALLHDPIAQVRRERPLTESFEKKSCKFGLQCKRPQLIIVDYKTLFYTNVDDGGEMTFFLGFTMLPLSHSGYHFINQSNYVLEILKKYGMESCDPVGTPMEIKDKLDLDQKMGLLDATKYRSMIGALMYLTSSRPDIVHATCLCARYQAKPTEKHLKETPSRVLPGRASFLRRTKSLVSCESLKEYKDCTALFYRGSRICVSIRLLCPSHLDAGTQVNGTMAFYFTRFQLL